MTILKQASTTAGTSATEDQASDHTHQGRAARSEFELNVTEDRPTTDQLRSILEYLGARRAGDVIAGARDEADAMRKLKENGDSFIRPLASSPGSRAPPLLIHRRR